MSDISNEWSCQYQSLEYVFNDAFSGVMCSVGVDELLGVVSNLPENKAAGLSGISNKFWKHYNKSVLEMLLVLLNFCLIYKSILSKIFLDRISLVCNTFDVLHGDNFSVLKSTMMQSLIFAIGLVVENALEKGCELWLVLQDMWKTYDSVGLVRIKMCSRFIRFFGGIHNDRINRIMTDFGLTDGYKVHNGLDQGEVFSLLLWYIFYDPLLCEVKKQVDGCGYKLNSYFISGDGHAESQADLFSFFTAGAFHILNVASKFFDINNISINNDKTVAISINCKVADPFLLISRSPISIAKRGELHHYLGIYLSIKGLSKPSLAKTHSDVWFFANLVLKKVVSDKQFSYLVFLIIDYRTQFSYVPVSTCENDAIHHLFLYSLKTFEQIQAENKSASIIFFANSSGYLVHVKVNPLNNFLANMVHIFSGSDLSLCGSLTNAFCRRGGTPVLCSCAISANLLCSDVGHLSVYMDGFLNDLGSVDIKAGAAVFFENIGMSLDIGVSGLMSSTLTEL
ncbi:hypothetical protein G9A89_008829 [Geosiphon pyriformis]|nr:hypothetical protein G9A89_008829 [Geosiphon pyriformis]